MRHLITAIEELAAAGIAFVSTGENIDTTSPTGRLLLGIMGSFAEFERVWADVASASRQTPRSASKDYLFARQEQKPLRGGQLLG